jgi:hypothetical protein
VLGQYIAVDATHNIIVALLLLKLTLLIMSLVKKKKKILFKKSVVDANHTITVTIVEAKFVDDVIGKKKKNI